MSEGNIHSVVAVFARNLKYYRKRIGLSQELLAERAGLDRTYISGCERGVRNPTISALAQIAVGLEIDAEELLKQRGEGEQ